jgi:hypothetical protein
MSELQICDAWLLKASFTTCQKSNSCRRYAKTFTSPALDHIPLIPLFLYLENDGKLVKNVSLPLLSLRQ